MNDPCDYVLSIVIDVALTTKLSQRCELHPRKSKCAITLLGLKGQWTNSPSVERKKDTTKLIIFWKCFRGCEGGIQGWLLCVAKALLMFRISSLRLLVSPLLWYQVPTYITTPLVPGTHLYHHYCGTRYHLISPLLWYYQVPNYITSIVVPGTYLSPLLWYQLPSYITTTVVPGTYLYQHASAITQQHRKSCHQTEKKILILVSWFWNNV